LIKTTDQTEDENVVETEPQLPQPVSVQEPADKEIPVPIVPDETSEVTNPDVPEQIEEVTDNKNSIQTDVEPPKDVLKDVEQDVPESQSTIKDPEEPNVVTPTKEKQEEDWDDEPDDTTPTQDDKEAPSDADSIPIPDSSPPSFSPSLETTVAEPEDNASATDVIEAAPLVFQDVITEIDQKPVPPQKTDNLFPQSDDEGDDPLSASTKKNDFYFDSLPSIDDTKKDDSKKDDTKKDEPPKIRSDDISAVFGGEKKDTLAIFGTTESSKRKKR